jgi:VWFA-related protein
MISKRFLKGLQTLRFQAMGLLLACLLGGIPVLGQDSGQNGQQNPNAVPEAGGPNGDVGPYATPKKKEEPPAPPPEKPKKIEGMPDYSIHVDVPLVEVPVLVTSKDGQFISTLKKENFRVYEDGQEQTIANFGVSDAPITAVLLIEFASTNYGFENDARKASYAFVETLKKNDWVSVITYNMNPEIVTDFTQNKQEIYGALNSSLRIPTFSETNLFDALYDTLDRIDRIQGHKYVILVTTGVDSFSRINLDQIYKKIKATKDVTIFPISVGFQTRERYEAAGGAAPRGLSGTGVFRPDRLTYLQADNEVTTFARMTGGRAYFPRFDAEYIEIFRDIAGDIRNQYLIGYHPTNPKLDGSYRKLKVDVVAPDGGQLKVKDQKGKDVKLVINAREGYTAKHTVD